MAFPLRSRLVITTASQRPFAVRRFGRFLILCGLMLVLLFVLHISVGSESIELIDVLAVVLNTSENDVHYVIVHDLRMPRALVALMVGAMLGLSGAILQSVTQNPLASPSLTGVLSGGVLAMVLWIYLGPADQQSGAILPLISIAGGLLAGMLVYALAWHKGTDPVSLTLAGVLVAAILNAFISLVLLIDQQDTAAIITWIVGSLNGRTWIHFETLAPYALFALPAGLAVAGMANALHLGDGVAAGLGLRVEWTRGTLLATAVILAAGAVSVVGNITFVGLIAPHIARRIVGGDARRLFPFSAVFAAGLLLAADIIARTLTLELGSESAIGINNLPVGAVTAMLGALFFFYLLTRRAV